MALDGGMISVSRPHANLFHSKVSPQPVNYLPLSSRTDTLYLVGLTHNQNVIAPAAAAMLWLAVISRRSVFRINDGERSWWSRVQLKVSCAGSEPGPSSDYQVGFVCDVACL